MFYILFRVFVLSSGFFKKSRKSFSEERDPAGVSLDVRTVKRYLVLESLIGVDNSLLRFFDRLL